MEIKDYEHDRCLSDVEIVLSKDELEELCLYLSCLLKRPEIKTVHLSQIMGMSLSKEVSISVDKSLIS